MNSTPSMDVRLELADAGELPKLLMALAEGEIEYTLHKVERKNRGKSNKMDVRLELHDPHSLLTVLQLEGIEFLLIKAEIKEPEALVTYHQHPFWVQPAPITGPYVIPPGGFDPQIIPDHPIVMPSTGVPPLDFWYQNTCEAAGSITQLDDATVDIDGAAPVPPSTSVVYLSNPCTVQGVAYDNFLGHRTN